jgi:hypothetical protein
MRRRRRRSWCCRQLSLKVVQNLLGLGTADPTRGATKRNERMSEMNEKERNGRTGLSKVVSLNQ